MRTNKPLPYPLTAFPDGELVNPFLRRISEMHELPSIRRLCRQLLARKTGLDCMPSCLDEFHSTIGHLFCDINTLVARHTHYHYYSRGLPADKKGEQRQRLLGKFDGPVRLCRLPVLFTPSEGEYIVCPDCRIRAVKSLGFEFVHRNSVAPFVSACSLHGRPLEVASKQALLFDQTCRSMPTRYQLLQACEFARRTAECVEDDLLGAVYQRENVKQTLRDARWVTDGGRLRLAELIVTFEKFFSNSFADIRLSILTSSREQLNNALRTLMREDRALHPVWCILIAWFAQECSFAARARRVESATAARHVVPDNDCIRELLTQLGSLSKVAATLKLDVRKLTLKCRLAGIDVSARPKILDDSQLEFVVASLKRGDKPTDISRSTRLSLATIYRVMAAIPGLTFPRRLGTTGRIEQAKKVWLSLRRRYPNDGVALLRHRAPAIYARLWRGAREWLVEQSPAETNRRPRPIRTRDAALLRIVDAATRTASTRCRYANKRSVRCSQYRMRIDLGLSEYAWNTSSSAAGTERLVEIRTEHVANRIRGATRKLRSQRDVPVLRLAKEAGLRKSTVTQELQRVDKSAKK